MDTLSFWISKVLVYENYAVPDFDFKFDDSEHLSNSLSCCGSRRSFYHTLDSGINATPGITEALPLKNFHITILLLLYINLGIVVIFYFFTFKALRLFRSLE